MAVRCGHCSTFREPVYHASVAEVHTCSRFELPETQTQPVAAGHADLDADATLAKALDNVRPLLPQTADRPLLRDQIAADKASRQAPKAQTQEVPAGRYALGEGDEVRFYRVDRPTEGKWKGYVFVKIMASDEAHSIRNRVERERVLAEIGKDPHAASCKYGLLIGSCGVCGRTLTNAESRARGMGDICAGEWGAA